MGRLTGYGREGALALSWNVPRQADTPPPRYLVQRRARPDGPAGEFRSVRTVDPGAPDGARVQRGEIEVLDFDLVPGERYEYRVVPLDGDGRPGPASPPFAVDWSAPPPPPRELRARPGNQLAELSWSPAGAPDVVGYNVYRLGARGAPDPRPRNRQPVRGTSFVDLGLENNQEYQYEVRAVIRTGDLDLEGPPSARASAIPRDLDPPPPPQGLEARRTPAGLRLRWQRVRARDLAGYRVYRRGAGISEYRCLTPTPIAKPEFLDREAAATGTWSYVVTAVDTAPSHNESGHSREMTVPGPEPESN